MKTTPIRVALMVATLVALTLVVVVVVRRDPYRPGTGHQVSVQMASPCANPKPLVLDGQFWDAVGLAPANWAGGSTHPGRLEIVDVDQGVFTADGDPAVTVPFRCNGYFSDLHCSIR